MNEITLTLVTKGIFTVHVHNVITERLIRLITNSVFSQYLYLSLAASNQKVDQKVQKCKI